MNGRQRVRAAMRYQPVDRAPLQYYYCPVGYFEHGERLNDLYATLPGDFEPFRRMPIPRIPDEDFDPSGRYHAFRRDEWGTLWAYRIFGITGIPCEYPLQDIGNIATYTFPPAQPLMDAAIRQATKATEAHQQAGYYRLMGAGSLFERMKALCPDEDVLCGIALDDPRYHALADRIIEHEAPNVALAVAAGADGISFGDDYGSERAMLLSPAMWRTFFKPRLARLFAPAVQAGLDIVFHSCGQVASILADLREVGATAVWPQLPAYDMQILADQCRALGLAVAIHTDRASTMTYGTPWQVRDLVRREYDTFRMAEGGSWFYVEADNGFPFENLVALVETIAEYR